MPRIALAGNPNVGKTTLFNAMTGMRQSVGNWPGVTVEKKEGSYYHNSTDVQVIDLPGTYTLGARTIDEKVCRDYLLHSSPEIVVVVSDALNLERSLYLLIQLLELRSNVVLVVNAMDEAKKNLWVIDKSELEKRLGIPVVFTAAIQSEGISDLKTVIDEMLRQPTQYTRPFTLQYSDEIERSLEQVKSQIVSVPSLSSYHTRWLSLKWLEGDPEVRNLFEKSLSSDTIAGFSKPVSSLIVKERYAFIRGVLQQAVRASQSSIWSINDALDHVFTHKYLGIPIFIAFLYMIFELTFVVAEPLMVLLEETFAHIGEWISASSLNPMIRSFFADGLIGGVGGVLVFLPNIFVLFLLMGVLEETGYFPRAAFVVDRLMVRLRLSGRSFMSMVLGFGCSVPAIMSTRTIESRRERIVTVLSIPFISCSARLPVYTIFVAALFPNQPGMVLAGIYGASVVLTAVVAYLLNRVLYKGKSSPLIMEMPRYRIPHVRNILIYMWSKGKHFLQKAGTIILLATIVIWALTFFPAGGEVEESYAASLGKAIQPIFQPLGFDWQATTSLIFGLSAKEVVISSLATLYGVGEESQALSQTLQNQFTPIVALSFLFFVMAYVPCFATLVVIKHETGRWSWMILSLVMSTGLAYVLAYLVRIIGGGW